MYRQYLQKLSLIDLTREQLELSEELKRTACKTCRGQIADKIEFIKQEVQNRSARLLKRMQAQQLTMTNLSGSSNTPYNIEN